jgi:hypothetical protein
VQHDGKIPSYARRVPLLGPIGGTLQPQTILEGNWPEEKTVTINIQNFSLPTAPVLVNINTEVQAGYVGEGALVQTAIGPLEAIRFRVSGSMRVRATAQNANTDIAFWTDTVETLAKQPPIASQQSGIAGGVYTPVGPNSGWAPAFKRYFQLYCLNSVNYDLKFEDFTGANIVEYLGLGVAGSNNDFINFPKILPPGFRVLVRSAAGPFTILSTWTEFNYG